MAQVADSRGVYRELVEASEEDWLYGLAAFAIIEEQRIEWIDHFTQTEGRPPTPQETANWYQQLPPGALLRAKGDAETALAEFALEAADDVLNSARQEILESAVVEEVRLARRFWPQFGISVAGGMISAFVFAAVLAVLTFVVWTDPSASGIIRSQIENLKEK